MRKTPQMISKLRVVRINVKYAYTTSKFTTNLVHITSKFDGGQEMV